MFFLVLDRSQIGLSIPAQNQDTSLAGISDMSYHVSVTCMAKQYLRNHITLACGNTLLNVCTEFHQCQMSEVVQTPNLLSSCLDQT